MTAQIIIAISAIVIALASLLVSVWASAANRKHHRLSVTPRLRVDYVHRPDQPIEVTLTNNGLGTAIVREFAVLIDDSPVSGTGPYAVVAALRSIGWMLRFSAYTPTPDDALSAGERVVVFSFPLADTAEGELQLLRECLSRLTFKIRYESLYGDRFLLCRKADGLGGGAEHIVGPERQ